MRSTKSPLLVSSRSVLGALLFSTALSITVPITSHAQTTRQLKEQVKAPDPSDLFFLAHTSLKDGEKLEARQQYIKAWAKYKTAIKHYKNLQTTHPLWKPSVLTFRIKNTNKLMSKMQPALKRQIEAEKKASAGSLSIKPDDELEYTASEPVRELLEKIRLTKADIDANIKHFKKKSITNKANLEAAKGQLALLTKNNQAAPEKASAVTREISRLESILKGSEHHQKVDQKKLQQELKRMRKELAQHSRAPLIEDINRYKTELTKRNQEIGVLTRAVLKSKAQKEALTTELQQTQTALNTEKANFLEIEKQLATTNKDSKEIVQALLTKLKASKSREQEADKKLKFAMEQIADLSEQLDQQTAQNKELQQQLKDITQDRDRLSKLMLENPDERIKSVVTQNLSLMEELLESKKTLERVMKEQGSNQDRRIKAETDFAVAKQRIIEHQKQNLIDQQRIKALEQNLADSQQDITKRSANPNLSPIEKEELSVLRKVAKKLDDKQKFYKDKLDMIRTEVLRRNNDPVLVKMFDRDNTDSVVTLSEKEKDIIKQRTLISVVDLGSASSVSPKQARRTEARLKQEVNSLISVGLQSLKRGRNQLAKELLSEANSILPYQFPTLVNLGCVTMKMRELDATEKHLKDAIVMKPHNSYAHYLLGMCYFEKREFDMAEKTLKHSLSLDKLNENTHYHLGVIAGEQGRLDTAELCFKSAVRVNPDFANGYFALSINYLMKADKKSAQDSYQTALKKGLAPNNQHEKNIGIAE